MLPEVFFHSTKKSNFTPIPMAPKKQIESVQNRIVKLEKKLTELRKLEVDLKNGTSIPRKREKVSTDSISIWLRKKGFVANSSNKSIIKSIMGWIEITDIDEALCRFKHKVEWEGEDYFYKSYTHAFKHWTESQKERASEIIQHAKEK